MEDHVHVAIGIATGAIAWVFFSPVAGFATLFGQLFPELDDLLQKRWHSAWVTHTAVGPTLLVLIYKVFPAYTALSDAVPWFAFGIALHVVLDYIYFQQRKKKDPHPLSATFGRLPDAMALGVLLLPHLPFLLWPWIQA